MTNNIDITPIITAIITIIFFVVNIYLIPFLKTKLTAAQRARIKAYIDAGVKAAEVLFPSTDGEKMGKAKLEYVAAYLKKRGIVFDVDDIYDDTRIMIESAVSEFTK